MGLRCKRAALHTGGSRREETETRFESINDRIGAGIASSKGCSGRRRLVLKPHVRRLPHSTSLHTLQYHNPQRKREGHRSKWRVVEGIVENLMLCQDNPSKVLVLRKRIKLTKCSTSWDNEIPSLEPYLFKNFTVKKTEQQLCFHRLQPYFLTPVKIQSGLLF